MKLFNIVLVEPQIPPNTGNIGRLCVGTDTALHLVHPLGFSLDEKALRRAGLDYWKDLEVYEYESLEAFHEKHPIDENHFFATTHAKTSIFEKEFKEGAFLYFGREDAGLPKDLIYTHMDKSFVIPMSGKIRSLNLSNSASIVLYEAIRQNLGN